MLTAYGELVKPAVKVPRAANRSPAHKGRRLGMYTNKLKGDRDMSVREKNFDLRITK